MMIQCPRWLAAVPLALAVGCGGGADDGEPAEAQTEPTSLARPAQDEVPDPAGSAPDHGDELALGTMMLGEFTFEVARLGELAAGQEGAFAVEVTRHPEGVNPSELNLYLWVESEDRAQVSAPAKGSLEGGGWHFHVTPRADGGAPVRVVLRLRHAGEDLRAGLPLSGHGHEHAAAAHDGVPAAFHDEGGAVAGHLELKLHDDKGDLELWLTRDEAALEPFDLPLDASVQVTFVDVDDRSVTLRVRNRVLNEDEDGTPNVRDGATHYFIYPGDSGEDSTWLTGADFSSIVTVSFEHDGIRYRSEEFVLVPHTHTGEGHEH